MQVFKLSNIAKLFIDQSSTGLLMNCEAEVSSENHAHFHSETKIGFSWYDCDAVKPSSTSFLFLTVTFIVPTYHSTECLIRTFKIP